MNNDSDYAKSSCACYQCDKKKYDKNPKGNPSNMSLTNCQFPDFFECGDSFEFNSSIQPTKQNGIQILNPQALQDKYDNNFTPSKCNIKGCNEEVYLSDDPRLLSVPLNQYLTLDRPPIQSKININEIATDKSLDNYGKNYTGYSDINAGQILYYIDNEIAEPFHSPNFSTSAFTTSKVTMDPMGQVRPSYTRHPLTVPDHLNTKREKYDGCLSWIQDSANHREDIMSKQMEKINKTRWEPRWAS